MKKTTVLILLIMIFCSVLFTGCHLSHDWEVATCTLPQRCTGCDKTIGEPKGHVWVEATCQSAKQCKVCWEEEGEPLPHDWQDATCEMPQTCAGCGAIGEPALPHEWTGGNCVEPEFCMNCGAMGEEPLPHVWTEPTCGADQQCVYCGEIGEPALPHEWTEATDTMPQMCSNCKAMIPMENPANGQVFIGQEAGWGATLSVTCSYDQACYVKMKDADLNDVISFYIAADDTAEICVPAGHYYVYFAHGVDWYGPEFLFGMETTYSKDDELTDYVNYSWSYELEPVSYGNFSDTPIDPSEF